MKQSYKKYFKKFAIITCILFMVSSFSGCMPPDQGSITNDDIDLVQYEMPEEGEEIAVIETDYGTIKIQFFPEYAPNAVENFKELIRQGYYDESTFFAIDKTSRTLFGGATDYEGQAGVLADGSEEKIDAEQHHNLWHFPGAISSYGSSTQLNPYEVPTDSRFFIVGSSEYVDPLLDELVKRDTPEKITKKYKEVGGVLDFSGLYTVFAHIFEGLEVVDTIIEEENTEEGLARIDGDVYIRSITLQPYSAE